MLRADNSSRKPLKEVCYSLLTIVIGSVSCSIIAVLAYFTYETAAGNMSYCTLWTDIPGRLAIFLTFYYATGVCGIFPIPEHLRLDCLPPPFILYRLESWTNLFRKICLLFTFNCQIYEPFVNDPGISPLRNGSNTPSYDISPTSREQSEKIPIAKIDTPKKHVVLSDKAVRHRDVEIIDNPEECSMSFDSSIGDPIVPMVKGKCTKPPYFTDSTISNTESSDKSILNAPTDTLYEVSGTLNDQAKAVIKVCSETDTPERTPDVKLPLPSYPRFPWKFLKHRNSIPQGAKALHKRHLTAERRELDKLKKKQKMEETAHSLKDNDSNQKTDSDELNPFAYRRFRLPLVTARSKTGFRRRTKTIPGDIRNSEISKTKIHKRMFSCTAPYKNQFCTSVEFSPKSEKISDKKIENKCCENSPDLQSKVEHIKKTLMRLGPNFQASSEAQTSTKNIDAFSGRKSGNEASTSAQYTNIFPSKNCGGDVSTSRQNIDDFPRKISDNKTSTSEQNTDTFSDKKN